MFHYPAVPKLSEPSPSGITCFNLNARPLFQRARQRAGWCALMATLARRSRRMPMLQDVLNGHVAQETPTERTRSVHLNAIAGSVNRSDDFDCAFYPLTDRLEDRWVRVASMMMQGQGLPPIEVVQVDDSYFVIDGHHRISVARMLGYTTLDAIVVAAYLQR